MLAAAGEAVFERGGSWRVPDHSRVIESPFIFPSRKLPARADRTGLNREIAPAVQRRHFVPHSRQERLLAVFRSLRGLGRRTAAGLTAAEFAAHARDD